MHQQSLHVNSARERQTAALGAAVVGCAALAVAMGIGRFAFTPILPMMQSDAGVSIAGGGWLAAANYLGYFVGALTATRVFTHPMRALRAGLAIVALSTVGMGLLHDFAAWIALRTAAGIGSAWILVFASAWALQRLRPIGQPLLNGFVFAGVGLGITVVGLICVALLHAQTTSEDAWLVVGAVSVGASAAMWPWLKGSPAAAGSTEASSGPIGASWRRLIIAYGFFGFGYIVPATFLPVMARQVMPDPAQFGWSWPVFGAAAAISTVIAAPAARVLGTRTVWLLAQCAMAIGVAAPLWLPGAWGVMLSAVTVGGTFMVVTMTGIQEAREVGSPNGTRLIAGMTAAFALGQLAGPILVSSVAHVVEPFSFAVALASSLLLIGAYLIRPSRHSQRIAYGARS